MPSVRRGRERAQPEQGGEADGEIDPHRDLVCDIGEVEHLIGDIEREMRGAVAEGTDPDHAAHVDELAIAGDPPQRRDRERQQQEHEHPKAGAVDQVIERAGCEPDLGLPGRDREPDRPEQEDQRGDA